MSRRFAVVVSALAAFAAQAQEAKEAGAQPATPLAGAESASRPVMVAIRADPPAPATARTIAPVNGGKGPPSLTPAGSAAVADCSVVETYLNGTALVVRTYEAPRATQTAGWTQAPFVASVTRCGRLYILQVWSKSRDPWILRQARVQAPGGVVLEVEALRSQEWDGQDFINVIVAKAPQGAKLPTLKLDLSGEDGRVAQAEVGDIP